MRRVEATEARQQFAETVNNVAYGKRRIVLQRHGRDIAALIPLDDLELLRQCEETPAVRKRATPKSGEKRGPAPRRRSPALQARKRK